jgi:hypothetical protein
MIQYFEISKNVIKMVLIITTIWFPPSKSEEMNKFSAEEHLRSRGFYDPKEKNQGLFTGYSSDKKGYKLKWVQKINREEMFINYNAVMIRATYICNNIEGATYQIEILYELEDLTEATK